MAITQEVLLKINTAQSAKTISELENGLKLARKALKDAELGSEDYNTVLKATTDLQRQLTNVTRIGTKEINEADSSYNALSRTLSILKEDYKKLGDGIERENLGKKIQDVNDRLKALDASTGVYSRNVGNYSSMFSNFQFQIQQVAREIPSLSNGFNTFFLAISNNLPMLSDEFARVRAEIKSLKAEGKQVPSLFNVISKSVFSWQTALVALLTMLTLYGKDILKWGQNMLSAARNTDAVTTATRNLNKAMQDENDTLADNLTAIRLLQMEWGLLGGDLEKQRKFVEDNQTAFANLGIAINDVSDFENAFIDNTSEFIRSLQQRAKATAAQELAQEAYKKALTERAKVEAKIARGTSDTVVEGYGVGSELMKPQRRAYTEAEQNDLLAPVIALEAEADAYLNIAANANLAADAILGLANIKKSSEKGGEKGGEKGAGLSLGDVNSYASAVDELDTFRRKWREQFLSDEAVFYDDLLRLEEEYAKDSADLQKFISKTTEEEAERQKKWQYDKYTYIASLANSASRIAGEETATGKALAVASATISTWLSAQKAFESQFLPIPTASSPSRGALAAAAAVASGIANVKSILSVKTDGSTASMANVPNSAVQTYAPATVQQVAVTRSLTGASEEQRLNDIVNNTATTAANTINPVKAYVVLSELEGKQLADQQTQDEASF